MGHESGMAKVVLLPQMESNEPLPLVANGQAVFWVVDDERTSPAQNVIPRHPVGCPSFQLVFVGGGTHFKINHQNKAALLSMATGFNVFLQVGRNAQTTAFAGHGCGRTVLPSKQTTWTPFVIG